ncbi:hypothetical protein [Jidongwangia harbinensis]|uniref:hypothetical protein n=1 Tax=Jidongwangia harbinensis TaxID=2878561 RepID=UPI001CD9EAD4|nr:hypothetical protein [Jidongwangia harbinensis]MCA2212138.1 hypothetical protein [Jidongwangia harbinensis]
MATPRVRYGRWALALAGVVLLSGLLLWVLPAWLTRHPSAGMSSADRLKAANDTRVPLVALLAAMGTAGTVYLAARSFRLNREGQITERYTRAVDQIGNDKLAVRIGGIYALERVGRDSGADRRTVVFVLGAFVRVQSNDGRGAHDQPSEDVYAALSVINRLAPGSGVVVDLRGADLRNARLPFMHEVEVLLDRAVLAGAYLPATWTPPT